MFNIGSAGAFSGCRTGCADADAGSVSALPGVSGSTARMGRSFWGKRCWYVPSTSHASMTSPAPSRISWLQPRLEAALMGPGTANTSLPCSSAVLAVISAPLFSGASTTTTARLRPLMMRLRTGKWPPRGSVPGGYSDNSTPVAAMSS